MSISTGFRDKTIVCFDTPANCSTRAAVLRPNAAKHANRYSSISLKASKVESVHSDFGSENGRQTEFYCNIRSWSCLL